MQARHETQTQTTPQQFFEKVIQARWEEIREKAIEKAKRLMVDAEYPGDIDAAKTLIKIAMRLWGSVDYPKASNNAAQMLISQGWDISDLTVDVVEFSDKAWIEVKAPNGLTARAVVWPKPDERMSKEEWLKYQSELKRIEEETAWVKPIIEKYKERVERLRKRVQELENRIEELEEECREEEEEDY